MISPAAIDALGRIQARASDVMQAYKSGASGTKNDVNIGFRNPEPSQDPLSVSVPQNAFLATRSAEGAATFTRDGALSIRNGNLVTSDGSPVLGFAPGATPGSVPVPLQLPQADVALGRCNDVRMESDGTLAFTRTSIDPRTTERTVERVAIGTVALARFPAGTQTVRLDATRAAAPPGIPPHFGTPEDGTFGGLATYSRDTGAIDIDTSLSRLSEAYIAFSAVHAAQKAHGNGEKTIMDLIK
jgi:hypothetical protein